MRSYLVEILILLKFHFTLKIILYQSFSYKTLKNHFFKVGIHFTQGLKAIKKPLR